MLKRTREPEKRRYRQGNARSFFCLASLALSAVVLTALLVASGDHVLAFSSPNSPLETFRSIVATRPALGDVLPTIQLENGPPAATRPALAGAAWRSVLGVGAIVLGVILIAGGVAYLLR